MIGPFNRRWKSNGLWECLCQPLLWNWRYDSWDGIFARVDYSRVTKEEVEYWMKHAPQPISDFHFIKEHVTEYPRRSCTL